MKRLLTISATLLFFASLAAEAQEERYFWFTRILVHDSTRIDAGVPLAFPDQDQDPFNNRQWRGVGQIVNPSLNYEWFDEVYNSDTGIYFDPQSEFTDQDYIEQFRNAGNYTIDTITGFFYSLDPDPASNSETLGAAFELYKTNFNLRGIQYRTQGYRQALSDLGPPLQAEFFDSPTLAANVNLQTQQVQQTVIGWEPGTNAFTPDESAVILYYNPLDPAYTSEEIQTRIGQNRPDQRTYVFAQTEYGSGDLVSDGQGGLIDTRADSLTIWKVLGLTLFRNGNGQNRDGDNTTDTVYSSWNSLFQAGRSAMMDLRLRVFGTVDLSTGVRYHYGRDAYGQGLYDVVPNPATDVARLPFSIEKPSEVTIEIYDTEGELRATLLESVKYINGNYDIEIPVDELGSGTYVARMVANGQPYSMKFTVTR